MSKERSPLNRGWAEGGALSPCQEKGLPNPGQTGGSETLRQMSLVPFFPLKTKQSGCVQWPLRKASHFLRRYQACPGIVSISSNGCYYLSSTTAGLSAVLGEVTRVFFLLFTGRASHHWCFAASVFCPGGMAQRLN